MTHGTIGGFFALEPPLATPRLSVWQAWTQGASSVHAFRNARGALTHLLKARVPHRLWLPAYCCGALAEAAAAASIPCELYPIEETLEPDRMFLRTHLRSGDAVVVIDYFGKPPSPDFIRWARAMPDIDWIEDRAQALEPGYAPGDAEWAMFVLFSPRKLLGVAEGGLLVTRGAPVPAPAWEDASTEGLVDAALLRFEGDAAAYARYLESEERMTCRAQPMTRLTRAILEHTDIAPLIEARRRNALTLLEWLERHALLPDGRVAYAPFGVPVRCDNRDTVAVRLRERGMFIPIHWREILGPVDGFPFERRLAAQLLTLPCDHRYTATDMRRLAAAFVEAA